jgi:endogenous inhibitor of DNA gyrase (YacG/DUF329 family)
MAAQNSIRCPICNTQTDFFADPLGPFCSDRCKMVDLSKWLGEEYRISEPLRPKHFMDDEDLEDSSPGRSDRDDL